LYNANFEKGELNFNLEAVKDLRPFTSDSIAIYREKFKKESIFRFQTLTENFYDFYQSFMYKTCQVCKKKNKFALCLLCGQILCVRSCTDPQGGNNTTGRKE
jgi:uncharacterized UBP type Zn finger protein